MAYDLRPYQQEAVNAAFSQLRTSTEPFIIEAATGGGKSVVIAKLAHLIHDLTGKRVLCTAPTKELVIQNRDKYLATGNPASMFSASAGEKSTRHPVVFGTPLTIKNAISRFRENYAMIVLDECDLITPTLKAIIEEMREGNPNLRVMGLTATPYRLGSGYIFREWPDGKLNGEDVSRDPYYAKCVYRIAAHQLIKDKYLTPVTVGGINAEGYDTHHLLPNKQGNFDSAEVDAAYHGHGRKTATIVADIVSQARERRGVLIFAATVRHAEEIMASLPPHLSAIITEKTNNRDKILAKFKAQEIKYIVNVAVLTVGVDMPHVDVVAVLRKTESVRLLQQIVGRGLRLYEGKEDCLYLDYTSNLEDHCPDGDLFDPKITARKAAGEGHGIEALCPECGYTNEFKLNPDYVDYKLDENGYCLDVFGVRIETDYGPMAAHYGRRCFGMNKNPENRSYERCGYYWTSKECENCGEKNDISARYCTGCRAELVDPNERLVADFKALKRDPTKTQCDQVLSMAVKEGISQKGNKTIRADFVTPYRQFSVWYSPNTQYGRPLTDWQRFDNATQGGKVAPDSVSYVKDADTSFYRTLAFNREVDEKPEAKGKST